MSYFDSLPEELNLIILDYVKLPVGKINLIYSSDNITLINKKYKQQFIDLYPQIDISNMIYDFNSDEYNWIILMVEVYKHKSENNMDIIRDINYHDYVLNNERSVSNLNKLYEYRNSRKFRKYDISGIIPSFLIMIKQLKYNYVFEMLNDNLICFNKKKLHKDIIINIFCYNYKPFDYDNYTFNSFTLDSTIIFVFYYKSYGILKLINRDNFLKLIELPLLHGNISIFKATLGEKILLKLSYHYRDELPTGKQTSDYIFNYLIHFSHLYKDSIINKENIPNNIKLKTFIKDMITSRAKGKIKIFNTECKYCRKFCKQFN